MGANGNARELTLPISELIRRGKLSLAALYPHATRQIARELAYGAEADDPSITPEIRHTTAWRVIEHRDGKPTQRQANADGSNLPAPVIAIQIVAPLGTSPLPYVPLREMGPALQMPPGQLPGQAVDAPQRPTEPLQQADASPVPPVRVSPPSKRKSSPPASMGTTKPKIARKQVSTPTPSPSEADLYGFDVPAPADGPGGVLRLSKDAAPNTREARYAQRQARLRALMGQQGKG